MIPLIRRLKPEKLNDSKSAASAALSFIYKKFFCNRYCKRLSPRAPIAFFFAI